MSYTVDFIGVPLPADDDELRDFMDPPAKLITLDKRMMAAEVSQFVRLCR